jgi:hypothetical protein
LPLSEKARVEVYLPDLPKQMYQNLLEVLEEEFTYTLVAQRLSTGSTAITSRTPVCQYEIVST